MSGERIDHVAEAARIMTDGESAVAKARDAAHNGNHQVADGYGAKAHGCWIQAQAHATLALVEQQRIANLNALSAELDPEAHSAVYVVSDEWGGDKTLTADLREALGLS